MPGSELRELYVKTPFYLNFRVYLFNLTNPDEVSEGNKKSSCFMSSSLKCIELNFVSTSGGKPKVQQVGPYFFELVVNRYYLFHHLKLFAYSMHPRLEYKRYTALRLSLPLYTVLACIQSGIIYIRLFMHTIYVNDKSICHV